MTFCDEITNFVESIFLQVGRVKRICMVIELKMSESVRHRESFFFAVIVDGSFLTIQLTSKTRRASI